MIDLGELVRGAGDDRRVEAKQQASKGADEGALHHMAVNAHALPVLASMNEY